jgi:hypothetical protein
MFSKHWKSFVKKNPKIEVLDPLDSVPLLNRSLQYRRFLRSVFQAPARLNLGGVMREVRVLDVSLKGALIDVGQSRACHVGARGRLRLSLSPTTFIAMDVAVTRVYGGQIGLQCLHIDLDSMTHLRQLMECNAQDPLLLRRDLSALVGMA